ncbi:ArnT family glycosyltransferase [Gymnodinialimonas ceratoperidinii]|uniref:Glycosyltransferase family 39 protein n=1 Tax=Gymnodinialimonas ceratoperidinii TaxID=2856823 RepID=A0A8F6TUM3_9RHOB|nr:glycosyltransferase family 39 protein [Gymnodinialimonas ceratoperidinii]QXT38985.1 glycosyltransferase family 39 protein [Gymnodinialimonas ceratoperidinii]
MSFLTARAAPLCVLFLALLSFGIGLAELPVQDRDEARFAQAARQMAASGDLIDIRLQDAPRHNKPALIYWAQAAAVALIGVSGETPIWVHRLPSYLAGALSALALIWAGTPLIGRRAAIIAGIICATVYMLHAEARTAKTDAALLLSVVLAMGALARLWLDPLRQWLTPLIFWTALAAGFLLKGPVILLPVTGAIIWTSVQFKDAAWLRRLRPLPGFVWFCLLVAPWFIAISLVTDGAFWSASVGSDLSNKITAEGEHAGSPMGFYLLTVWLTFFPWSIMIPPALMLAWQTRRDPKTAFMLGWLIPGWIVFEAVPVKLIHYTLPLFPALMLLTAAMLSRAMEGDTSLRRWTLGVGTLGWLTALIFFASVAFMAPVSYGDGIDAWASIGTAFFTIAGLAGLFWIWRGAIPRAIAALALSGLALGWSLTAASLPAARSFWIADQLVDVTASFPCLQGPVALAGYAEPSAVFRLGTDTILTDAEGALAYLEGGENRAAWIDPALTETSEDRILVEGISIGNFRPVALQLFVSPGVPATSDLCAD